jgi:divalent metal cation (Fe/Co/Zn/Cd) transporter
MAEPLRDALRVSYWAVAWSVVAGALSVAAGVQAGSTALIGTGTDLLADMLSSVVLVWRFRAELHRGEAHPRAEQRAHIVSNGALIVVALGVAAAGIGRLVQGESASAEPFGISVAAVSLVVLVAFGVIKYRIAARVPSAALRADGHITMVGASTAAMSLIGLAVIAGTGWHGADPVAALCIAAVAAATGSRGLRH